MTESIFNQLVDSAQTRWLTSEHRRLREALANSSPKFLAEPSGKAERGEVRRGLRSAEGRLLPEGRKNEGISTSVQTTPAPPNSGGEKITLLDQWANDENFIKFCQGQEASRKRGAGGKTKGEIFKALTLEKKLQTYCDNLKKSLPFVIFIATYIETASASGKLGCWRKQAACRLNGLCVIDFDHVDEGVQTEGSSPKLGEVRRGLNAGNASVQTTPAPPNSGGERLREIWEEAFNKLSDEDKARILLVYITPSGHGLKVVFMADVNVGNLIDNQKDFSAKLGLNPDEACKDASRGAFLTTREDIILINEEKLFTYENEEFGKRYNALYRDGHSQATKEEKVLKSYSPLQENYNGVPYVKIIEAWLDGKDLTNKRHDTLVELANHLRYLVGKNAKKIEEVVMQLPWVQDLAAEGENVSSTVASVIDFKYHEWMPKKMKEALEKVGAMEQKTSTTGEADDIYAQLPLEKWAEELREMAEFYPCMKELFLNVHPHKMPAVLFSSAALFGTLMTRAYYHFWYEPEIVRRLNYCIFIIGDPGA
ncbi:MAG: hypothetical protein IKH35_05220, partial [Prevotella sp.]|nr:hypothetical protein [Prevotella sp.]